MDIRLIHESFREEMVGAFERLADLVREGRLSSGQFLAAQKRIFDSYHLASLDLALIRMH